MGFNVISNCARDEPILIGCDCGKATILLADEGIHVCKCGKRYQARVEIWEVGVITVN